MAPWDFLFEEKTYKVGKNGVSPIQNMAAYLGGSAIQTVGDNPVTAYRQLVQQYAKNLAGETVAPAVATAEANAVFIAAPFTASMSGLWPRLIGVLFKRIPKFGVLLGYTYLSGNDEPGYAAATAASILSAPFINPVRMVEKQQRAFLKQTVRAPAPAAPTAPTAPPARPGERGASQRPHVVPALNPPRPPPRLQGTEKPIMEILGEVRSAAAIRPPLEKVTVSHAPAAASSQASSKYFAPLFRGTVPLMGHSLASAVLGLVGQPKLQKYVQQQIGQSGQLSGSATNLVASAVVSPIYVVVTNPLSRLEVIMQTNSIKGKSIGPFEAAPPACTPRPSCSRPSPVTAVETTAAVFPCSGHPPSPPPPRRGQAVRELGADMAKFGLSGIFRGQGIGIFKAIISLTLFHEGRLFLTRQFKAYNVRTGKIPATATA